MGRKGSGMQKGNIVALIILKQRQNKPTACDFYYDKEILRCGSLLSTRLRSQFWVFLSKSAALSTTTEGREFLGEWVE